MVPAELRYTRQHEWIGERPDGVLRIGITEFAQDALGDIVFVSLPELGAEVEVGAPMGEVESTKSVSEIYAPVAGTVSARNDAVETAPETINTDPYGDGWLVEITPTGQLTGEVLDAGGYQALVQG
ncbi:MAG: glycine cleavage system protein [Actinomycetota bacterium]|nr:glycine cleavage system protein [Actinomycetota bacterium]